MASPYAAAFTQNWSYDVAITDATANAWVEWPEGKERPVERMKRVRALLLRRPLASDQRADDRGDHPGRDQAGREPVQADVLRLRVLSDRPRQVEPAEEQEGASAAELVERVADEAERRPVLARGVAQRLVRQRTSWRAPPWSAAKTSHSRPCQWNGADRTCPVSRSSIFGNPGGRYGASLQAAASGGAPSTVGPSIAGAGSSTTAVPAVAPAIPDGGLASCASASDAAVQIAAARNVASTGTLPGRAVSHAPGLSTIRAVSVIRASGHGSVPALVAPGAGVTGRCLYRLE